MNDSSYLSAQQQPGAFARMRFSNALRTVAVLVALLAVAGCAEDPLKESKDELAFLCDDCDQQFHRNTLKSYHLAKAALDVADSLWQNGKHEKSQEAYAAIATEGHYFVITVHEGTDANHRIFQRATEYYKVRGDLSGLQQTIATAVDNDVQLKFSIGSPAESFYAKEIKEDNFEEASWRATKKNAWDNLVHPSRDGKDLESDLNH